MHGGQAAHNLRQLARALARAGSQPDAAAAAATAATPAAMPALAHLAAAATAQPHLTASPVARRGLQQLAAQLRGTTCRGSGCAAGSAVRSAAASSYWRRQQRLAEGLGGAARQSVRGFWRDRRGYQHFDRQGGWATSRTMPEASRRKALYVVGGTCGVVGLVYWSGRQEVPYSHRMHCVLMSPGAEAALGTAMFAQVVSQAASAGRLLPDGHRAVQQVRQVGARVAAVASNPPEGGGFTDHMKGLNWEYAVIDSPDANAFVVPGGKVVVYTGLLRMLRDQDELAAVLAHETAHVLARHPGERMTLQQTLSLFQILAYHFFGLPIPSPALALAFFLPHSRRQETEADVIGMQLAAQACFRPGAAAAVFTRLGEYEKKHGADSVPQLLRTHPVTKSRVEVVNKRLPEAEATYHKAGCGGAQEFWGRF